MLCDEFGVRECESVGLCMGGAQRPEREKEHICGPHLGDLRRSSAKSPKKNAFEIVVVLLAALALYSSLVGVRYFYFWLLVRWSTRCCWRMLHIDGGDG